MEGLDCDGSGNLPFVVIGSKEVRKSVGEVGSFGC